MTSHSGSEFDPRLSQVSETLPFRLTSFLDLVGRPVPDEYRFTSPLDDDVSFLGDVGELDSTFARARTSAETAIEPRKVCHGGLWRQMRRGCRGSQP